MRKIIVTVLFCMSFCAPLTLAETSEASGAVLHAGVLDAPPFTSLDDGGDWEGLSIELWRRLTDELKLEGSVRGYTDIVEMRAALANGEVDVLLTVPATQEHETEMDLTQPYYRSGFGIAVAKQDSAGGMMGYLAAIDLSEIAALCAGLAGLWFMAGGLLYLLEHRRNEKMFGGGAIKGTGQGMWWAAVTMTTVGYGDKAPLTLAGRLLAIIWMMASIVLISSFTASIAASLTSEQLRGKVRGPADLPHVRVGSVEDTQPFEWLGDRGIAAASYGSVHDALDAIAEGQLDAFLFDEAVLKSTVATDFPSSVTLLPHTVSHYYLGMAVANGNDLRESIDRALLGTMAGDEWERLLARYGLHAE